jgi:choline dehydrogenase
LQRSGIGPGNVLKDAGVRVVHDLPGVGENLQDHIEVYFQYRCKEAITLNSKLGWFSKGLIGVQWLLTRGGLGGTNHFESGAFIRSRAGLRWPDIQFHFLPAAMRYDGARHLQGTAPGARRTHKPASRGSVRITAAAIDAAPEIRFITCRPSRTGAIGPASLAREILNQPAMDEYRGERQPAST